ncbi:MAG: phosphatidate cytidylyltransferase [Oscillospiraceae bacterium]|nr:phosphatidate cytidylyltransferase [Oscillospiraceae bacterium]
MLKRIITGIVALIIFIPVLFFSHTVIFDITIAALSLLGTLEFLKCVKIADKYLLCIPSCTVAFLVPLLYRNVIKEIIIIIVIVYLFCLLYASVFVRKYISTNDVALSFFSAVYVTVSFTSILIVRALEYGEIIYLMIFIGAWSTDTFAYFTGRLLGKHKLMPDISPNKTIEGTLGGVVFCSLSFVLFGFIISVLNRFDAEPYYILLAAAGVFTSIVAQLGDLSASAVKRNYGADDFGAVFPGHGGILDRFDSVMAVAPIIMIIGALFTSFEEYGLFI